jgi:leucyl-tRNA synthetase
MAYNTAIAAMMEFVNLATKSKARLSACQAQRFAILLEPFAPHMAEELYHQSGGDDSLAYAAWPSYQDSMLVADTVTIPVQVNGKLKATAEVEAGADKNAQQLAAEKAIAGQLEGEVKRIIVVPGRMVNFVVAK